MTYRLDIISPEHDGPHPIAEGITRATATKQAKETSDPKHIFYITPTGKLYPSHRWDRRRQKWVRTSF